MAEGGAEEFYRGELGRRVAAGAAATGSPLRASDLVEHRADWVARTIGGDGQPQTQAALLTRMLDRGLAPQAAVEAPRWLYGRT